MAIMTKSLDDILATTQNLHHQLAHYLERSLMTAHDEKIQILLGYLSRREEGLQRLISNFRKFSSREALSTWFYDYGDRHDQLQRQVFSQPDFAMQSPEQVISHIADYHDNLLDLYVYLQQRAETEKVKSVLDELINTMRSETQRIQFALVQQVEY